MKLLSKVFENQLQMKKLRDKERKEESIHKELGPLHMHL